MPIFPSSKHKIFNQFELDNKIIFSNCDTKTKPISLLQKAIFWWQDQIVNISFHSLYNYYQWDIYYECNKLDPQPNINSFNTIRDDYSAYDKNYMYVGCKFLTWVTYPVGVWLSQWSIIYLMKKNKEDFWYLVYIYDKKIEKPINKKTFQFLPWRYSFDNSSVFLQNKILTWDDPESFVVLGPGSAYDKNHQYKWHKIVE